MHQQYCTRIRRLFNRLLRFWPVTVGVIVLVFIIFTVSTYLFYIRDLATPESLMNRNNTGLILTDRYGTTFFKSEGVKQFVPVSFDQIPQSIKQATIAIEDKDFYKHPGFSLISILRALYYNFLNRSATKYGASTITQQLIKNALLSPEKSLKRKFQEVILAIEVERRFSKDQILEMYLNSIYYGSGAYGVSEASKIYFSKEVEQLTLAESALLAALPQAPSRYTPFGGDQETLNSRKDLVLTKMAEQGYISDTQKTKAQSEKIVFASPPKESEAHESPHFAVWVRDYLYQKYGEAAVNRLGFKLKTSLDLPLQRIAESTVKQQVAKLASQHVSNGGLIAFDPHSGEVITMVGSVDWYDEKIGKYNVVFAHRQPGSSFKPIVYTQAFRDGLKTTDILHDQATDFNGYKPKDYDARFRGDVTLRRALANSLNVPAVELLQKVGINNALTLAQEMGITTLSDTNRYGLSLVLGGGEVELFELTRAYGVLASGGWFVPTHPILSIDDKFGKSLFSYNPATKEEKDNLDNSIIDLLSSHKDSFTTSHVGGSDSKRVVDEASAYITTHILSDDRARSEVFGSGSALLLSRPAAAKTGTTDDYRDAWTVGYTPDLVAGVWIGNNDNAPMGKVAGSIGAAPIWHNFMEAASKNYPVRNFPVPADIVQISVCTDRYERACSDCKNRYTEVFKRGQEPTNICSEEYTPTPSPLPSETPQPSVTSEPSPTAQLTTTSIPTPTPSPTSQPTPTALPTIAPHLTIIISPTMP